MSTFGQNYRWFTIEKCCFNDASLFFVSFANAQLMMGVSTGRSQRGRALKVYEYSTVELPSARSECRIEAANVSKNAGRFNIFTAATCGGLNVVYTVINAMPPIRDLPRQILLTPVAAVGAFSSS